MFRLIHSLALGLALALTACAPSGTRDQAATMTSVVAFDQARFAGRWHEVAAIGRLAGATWEVEPLAHGAVRVTTSLDGTGEGRFVAAGRMVLPNFPAPLWVLWVDADYRTVLLGTPGGGFAILLDRDKTIAQDRLRAAREILDWNGYDTGALR